jgi:hypothetical protein
MRILDLDLDFFVKGIARSYRGSQRPDDDKCIPWTSSDVALYLEQNCGLSAEQPISGKILVDHHEAFFYWRRLIAQGLLTIPFEVVHVDAHADLGVGESGWAYIAGDLLHRPVGRRYFPEVGFTALNLSNYLAFACACRWISRLTYVRHPNQTNDFPAIHFKGFDTSCGSIQLKSYEPEELSDDLTLAEPIACEPEIPFVQIPGADYRNEEPFDFIVLCQSPGFTPASADLLIPLIASYIDQNEFSASLTESGIVRGRRRSGDRFGR